MSFSKQQVSFAISNKFIEDFSYQRNHPFYKNWDEWKEIVFTYHSPNTVKLQKAINKGSRVYDSYEFTCPESYLIDETFWLTNQKQYTSLGDGYYGVTFPGDIASNAYFVEDCTCYRDGPNLFDNKCEAALIHLQANILSTLWCYYDQHKIRRSNRKYYKRLERVILSLPYKYLVNFDLTLITNPPRYTGRGRHLLKELYERAYFDSDIKNMPFQFEHLKHFVKSQGGTIPRQSFRDGIFLPGTLDLGLELAKTMNFNEFQSRLLPKSQGVFDFMAPTVNHNVNLMDDNFSKFRNLISDSQTEFFKGLKDTIMESGKQLFCLFAAASTVCLLSKAVVSVGIKVTLKLLHMIYSLIAGKEDLSLIQQSYAHSQSGDDESVEIPFIPSMILNYIIAPPKNILSKIWNSPNTDRIMRRIGFLGDIKIDRGIERMIEWMTNIITTIKKWYSIHVLGLEWKDIESDCHVIVKWHEEVDDLLKTYFDGTMIWTDTTWGVVYNLYSRGLKFTREAAYNKYKNDVWKVVNKLGNILEQFKTHGCSNQQIRNPPVTIYLYGGTGAGKSSITYPLAVEILKGIFEKEKSPIDLKKYWKSLIYMRAPEQEFWDGYENQLVTVFDDFSQLVDGAASPNLELFEIIRASNCFPYPLHMASLDQKANTTFTSKVIIVSSNMSAPQTESLNYPDALKRRFDISVKVERTKKGHSDKFDPTQYRLTTYNMMTNLYEEHLSYEAFSKKCVDQYFSRKNFVSSVESYIMDSLADFKQDIPKTIQEQKEEAESTYVGYDTVDYPDKMMEIIHQIKEDETREKNCLIEIPQSQAGDVFEDAETGDEPGKEVKELFENFASKSIIRESVHGCWLGLKQAVDAMRSKLVAMNEMWTVFKNKHSYISKAIIMISVISAGLMFLKVFHNIRSIFGQETDRQKRQEVPKSEGWLSEKIANFLYSDRGLQADNEDWVLPQYRDAWKVAGCPKYYFVKHGQIVPKFQQASSEGWFSYGKTSKDTIYEAHNIDWIVPQFKQRWVEAGQPMYYKVQDTEIIPCAKPESYVPKKMIVPKTEAYTAKQAPKMARLEAYTAKEAPKIARLEAFLEKEIPKSEGVKDLNATEILDKIVRKNLYKMYESTRGAAIGHILFLKGQIAVMPKHYLVALYQSMANNRDATVVFEAVFLTRSFEIKIIDLLECCKSFESPDENDGPIATRDLLVCNIKTATVHTDATQFFVTKESVCRTDSTEVMLPVLVNNNIKNSERAVMMIRYATGRSQLSKVENLPVADDDNVITRYIRDAWMYNLDTQDSECGSPLIIRNTLISPGKICGIHVAGLSGTGQGWSTPLYHEDVIKMLKFFPMESQMDMKTRLVMKGYDTVAKEQCQVPEEAEFIRIGALEKPIAQPVRTKIEKSPIFGNIQEPLTKPCALRPVIVDDKEFDPRKYRLGRLGNFPKAISEELIINSSKALTDEISSVLAKTKDQISNNIKAVYSFEEAVKGIDGEDFVNAIKRDTSAGFPFVQMPNMTRKDMFGREQEYDLSSPQCEIIKKRVFQIIEEAKKGVVLDHYFCDTLKDERKPIHKAHKTRLFSAGPVDYLIACKMYYNGIVALLSKNRNNSHVSVGTNVYSPDWNEIVRVLHRKSKHIVAGDFEGFDASQQQRLLEMSGEVLVQLSQRFLKATDEDVLVMRVLNKTLINSFHITGKEIYQWTHSLASGHYLTAIVNSIFVNIVFASCWQIAHDEVSYMSARSFWKTCGIVAYGDDHLVSVPESKLDIFNQLTVPIFMSQLGLSYTMEDKDAIATEKARSIEEVSYLKRKFYFDKNLNRFICPLTLETVLEFPMWVHRCPDPKTQTIVELETAIKELSLHPKEIWNYWFPILNREAERLDHYTDLQIHSEVRSICLATLSSML
nr:MAG: RNA-dependent RNA polymerase [Riboviria sp.]